MAELMFVNTSNPRKANPKARKLIRSHISKRQHEQKRVKLAQALELEEARRQALEDRDEDDTTMPQYDSAPSSLSSSGSSAPAGKSEYAEKRVVTPFESLAAYEPGSRRVDLVGASCMDPYTMICTSSGTNAATSRPPYHLSKGDPAGSPRDYKQHAPVLSKSSNNGKNPVVLNERRDYVGELLSSWKGVAAAEHRERAEREEEAEHASHPANEPITNPNTVSASRPLLIKARYAAAPRINYSLDDPVNELNAFSRKLGINVSPLLHHFYKVVNFMATISESKLGVPDGYILSTWTTSMRVDPAARAAILFSAAVSFRLVQKTPFHIRILHILRDYALRSIRAALGDPRRSNSDAILVAVTTVAQSELLCGWYEDCRVHQRGLAQIREARGPTVARFLHASISFIDDLSASELVESIGAAAKT